LTGKNTLWYNVVLFRLKEKKMANKKFFLGMLIVALAFGMTVVGCDDGDDPTGESNPYKGEWSGSFKQVKDQVEADDEIEAKITFTDDTWTLTAGEEMIKGTYTRGTLSANMSVDTDGGSFPAASGRIILGLTVTFNAGTFKDSKGSFTRVKATPSDPFKGDWEGTLTSTGTPAATLNFTDTNWTLTVGGTPTTGTYTKSSLGYTSTLKTTGDVTYATGLVNPLDNTLTVTFFAGTYLGSKGTFTRPATP
jgi:hypothetical protein